jgi:nanoRNase/pAp phosphatase (c-di-AMP/oligoRNAs hydrolase)
LRKQRIATIAEKNRIIGNIIAAMVSRDNFVLLGHKNPDEDCIASMVAFSLLLSKFRKSVSLVICSEIHQHFQYLLNICKYNSIAVLGNCRDLPARVSTLVVFDTPKPSLLEDFPGAKSLLSDPKLLRIEIDHHLEADSAYIGDPGYRLVDEASSASELVGYIGFKLQKRCELLEANQISELFSRNLVLAILTGIIGDSKMGKYLKTSREKWFYHNFSTMFNDMLASKTYKSSRNFSTMEELFGELEKLSEKEDLCYRYLMTRKDTSSALIYTLVLHEEDTAVMTGDYDQDTIVTVARYSADRLAEESGCLSLVVYYDDPALSRWIQFRMRRSQAFKALDLRRVLKQFAIANGGGHPGAIGFRLDRSEVADIDAYTRQLVTGTEAMVREART